MKKVLSTLLACLLIITCFAACKPADNSGDPSGSSDTPKQGGTLICGIPGDPSSYNPDTALDEAAGIICYQIFNGLVLMNGDMEILPDLAESWAYNEDATELSFKLREDVKWHDGTPFTSADVKWTFDTIIANAGTISGNLASVAEITTPDDYNVVFVLSQPDSALLSYFTWLGSYILPKHLYEGTDWNNNAATQVPVGTGPFKFSSAQAGVSIELVANTDYFGDGPYLDRIVYQIIPDADTEYQMWQNGEIDYMYNSIPGADVAKYQSDPNYSTGFKLMCNRNYFTFNFAKEDNPFLDVRMRQALNLALNRQQILDTGLKGNGGVSEYYISPLYSWALNEDAKIPAQDIEEARRLIEECGYTADADGIYLQVNLDTFGFDETLIVAQANLREAGIDLQINKLEQMTWVEKIFSGNYDVTILGGQQEPDVSSVGNRVTTGAGINIAFYSNPELDALFAQGLTVVDEADRAPIYREVQAIMAEELPMVICNEVALVMAVRSNIHGVPLIDEAAGSQTRNHCLGLVWIDD